MKSEGEILNNCKLAHKLKIQKRMHKAKTQYFIGK